MATGLTSIFGSEIIVNPQGKEVDREYSGYAGSDGLTSMYLGGRGSAIIVRGIVRGTGNTYDLARADAAAKLAAIEAYQTAPAADYTFKNDTYLSVVWYKVEKVPDATGKVFYFNSKGEVIVNFIAYGRSLI
jgi:hypothetical protein